MAGLHLTVDEKVMLHLWAHSMLSDAREAPFQVTQHGIAASVGIIRSAVPRSVKKLVERGWVEERLAHVGRLNRRRKCYFLTKEGRLECERLRGGVLDSSVIVEDGGKPGEVPVGHLEKITGTSFDPLEVVMGTDEKGRFDGGAVTARREQLKEFFSEASMSSKAPDDKGTMVKPPAAREAAAVEAVAPAVEKPFLIGHPPELKYFFGRDAELERLGEWYDEDRCRVMLVFGLPGVGKSSIGSRFTEDLRRDRSDLSALWVKVHRWDGLHSVLGRFAEFMTSGGDTATAEALTRKEGGGPGEYARVIAGGLGEGSLVVMDDLHTAETGIRDLMGALFETLVEERKGKVLILSRAVVPFYDRRHVAVDGFVNEMELGGLDRESARSLLELKGHDVAGDGADRLIQASGGHPLYLELFDVGGDGAAVTSGDGGGGGDGGRDGGTGGPSSGDTAGGSLDLDSHHNVSMFIEEEVYARLGEPQRLLLERASAFRYPVPREAFFIDGKADLPSLMDLNRRSILRETDGRYEMHEVLRTYVYQNTPVERMARIHSTAARFYDDLLAAIGPGDRAGGRSHAGHREASEVAHHLIRAGDVRAAADFLLAWGGALVRGPYSGEVEVQIGALLEPESLEDLDLDAVAGIKELLGDLYTGQGQLDKALEEYSRLLDSMRGEGPVDAEAGLAAPEAGGGGEVEGLPPGAGSVLRKMALIHERQGELPRAFGLLKTSEELARSVKDFRGHILNLGALGWLHWRQGDIASSREFFEKSMKHLMKLDEMPGRVKELMGRGLDAARDGDLEGALHDFESSVELLERNEDLFDILKIYDNIGDQYFKVLMAVSMFDEARGGDGGGPDDGQSGPDGEADG